MRVLIAPQEFKGTLTASEAAAAISDALSATFPNWVFDLLPMADGGDGTVRALLAARGGTVKRSLVHDPLLRPVEAEWAILPDGMAVIEWAAATGLWRLAPAELDPRRATSFGSGELVRLALDSGCRRVLLGLGGSGTNDGGAGLAQALGFRLRDATGADLPPGGAALSLLDRIDVAAAHPAIAGTNFLGATDVTNPLCGPEGASATYGPQKGADAAAVAELDQALTHFADVMARDLGIETRDRPGAGAAGGGGAAALAFLGATLQSGAAVVGDAAGLEARVRAADVVVTGEGRLDGQTSFGKGPLQVARLARACGRPVVCVAGSLGPGHERSAPSFDVVEVSSNDPAASLPPRSEAATAAGSAATRALSGLLVRRPDLLRLV